MRTALSVHLDDSDRTRAEVVEPYHAPDGYLTVKVDGDSTSLTMFVDDPVRAVEFADQIVAAALDLRRRREVRAEIEESLDRPYMVGDKVRVVGRTSEHKLFIPEGLIATVASNERYGHVRVRAEGYEPRDGGPDWQYPTSSVELVERARTEVTA